MHTCRNKGLINPEECNANACKALVARLVVQEPMALGLLTSRAYLDYIGELSKIMYVFIFSKCLIFIMSYIRND